MRIVQFGLPFSPNLGDGVIADCFAHGVRHARPETEVTALDLSGRSGFGTATVGNRAVALALLRRMPRPLRQAAVAARLRGVLALAAPGWAHALEGADLAVIGGGQLFSDADLNFPLKVARAADLAGAAGVPLAVYAAGAAENWSARGTALYARLFAADLRGVGLRDAASIDAWISQTGGRGPAPILQRDPGLLAASCYGPVAADARIGLCVAAPEILAYHAENGRPAGARFLSDLIAALLAAGHSLRLFTNGAEEDAAALDRLAPTLADDVAAGRVEIAPRPARPSELAKIVGSCRAVVAHRLHACILAYAYGRPVVGMGWDRKVESFFASVGEHDAFAPVGTAPQAVVARLETALDRGIDPGARQRAEDEAQAAIADLLALAGRAGR